MTTLHKLAQRLGRLQARGGVVLVALLGLASCDIPVRPRQPIEHVVQIVVVPESLSLAPTTQQQFAAYGRTANGDSTALSVSWSATGGSITGDGVFDADTVPGDFTVSATSTALRLSASSRIHIWLPPVASVTVAPTAASLQLGQTVQLRATPRDVNGTPLWWRVVTWASDNPSVAAVNASGLVTANTGGSATITATSGGQSGSAAVSVTTVPVASVTVSPLTASLQVGQAVQLLATPRDANGTPLTGRVVTWASDNFAVATVNGSGLVTAQASGSATITATSEGQSGASAISVTQPAVPVASVSVTPATLGLTVGQTGQLTATPRDANGTPLTGRVVTWASGNTVVATVNGSGLVTARASGSATITATSEGQSGSATVTVTNVPVASVTVTPATASLQVGQTVQLAATPRDANGTPLTGRIVTWASDNTVAATVNGSGLVTAKVAGSATITATSEGQSGTAAVTVTQIPVASVTVTPATASLQVGQTTQLTATPRDANGTPLSGRVVTWASNNVAAATVNGSGLVTAKAAGSATITATSEGQSGSATVTVTSVPVASVTVSPATASLQVGQTVQLAATPRDANGTPLTGRIVTWASDNTVAATVNGSGLVTAKAAGSATITATSEGKNGSATVTVTSTGGAISGLDFPGSAGVTTTMRFVFNAPMAAYPATYIWRVNPRRQTGYYTAFFHADNNTGIFNANQEYYGFHPYPDPPLTGTPKWEISIGGGDVLDAPVVFDRWYVQVAVCYKSGGQAFNNYYWDWPDTTKVIRWVGPVQSPGPNPAIIVGDAPWNQGNEVWDGVIRGFQFYDRVLIPSVIAQEIAAPGSVQVPWYLNLNPTPSDISDKSGNGHHPSWVGPERPTLWTGTGP